MERLASATTECADSDGRFKQSAQPRGLCILPEHSLRFYCFHTSTAIQVHGQPRLIPPYPSFCPTNTGGLSLYVIDDSIHIPPQNTRKRSSTRLINFLCSGSWRQTVLSDPRRWLSKCLPLSVSTFSGTVPGLSPLSALSLCPCPSDPLKRFPPHVRFIFTR